MKRVKKGVIRPVVFRHETLGEKLDRQAKPVRFQAPVTKSGKGVISIVIPLAGVESDQLEDAVRAKKIKRSDVALFYEMLKEHRTGFGDLELVVDFQAKTIKLAGDVSPD